MTQAEGGGENPSAGGEHRLEAASWTNRTLLLMCAPAALFFAVFAYLPMPGLYLAFIKYNYTDGIFQEPVRRLRELSLSGHDGDLWRLTFNTIAYNLAFIVLGNFLQIPRRHPVERAAQEMVEKVSRRSSSCLSSSPSSLWAHCLQHPEATITAC